MKSGVRRRYYVPHKNKEGKILKRYDNRHRLLKTGESQRKDGYYVYRWTARTGKRNSIMAPTLEELREKETTVQLDQRDGIKAEAKNITLNQVFSMWSDLKRGLKDNTFRNYCYMYEQFVRDNIGGMYLRTMKKSDIRRFYNTLVEQRNLKISTVDNVHTVVHQILDLAVEEGYMRANVSDNTLKELKKTHNSDADKRKALTAEEQKLFLDYLSVEQNPLHHWYSIFAVMVNTGMRVGEITGLRWCDVDLENGIIDVNHTLVYYDHGENGCCYNIHTPKTEAGKRQIPMLDIVKEAFLEEKQYQKDCGIQCKAEIDGYTDFIFVNRFGNVQNQGTLNKALRRIIRTCNDEQIEKNGYNTTLLPKFSCHSLRHTFTTRLVEEGVNIKVVQDVLGHKDVKTTLQIYTDATEDFKKREFVALQAKMNGTVIEVQQEP